jgi:hydrogenase nickel incorporation protein HypA/HybF
METAATLLPTDAAHVVQLRIQLGALAGVSKEELTFGFEVMAKQTSFDGAHLEIEVIPAVVHCPQCGVDFSVADADHLLCPTCATPAGLVMQGKDLLLVSIEVRDRAVYA